MEFINVALTSLMSVIALFVIAKIMGHKQMEQLNFLEIALAIAVIDVVS